MKEIKAEIRREGGVGGRLSKQEEGMSKVGRRRD